MAVSETEVPSRPVEERPSARRIVLERPSAVALDAPTVLAIRKLEVCYGSHRAVRDVTLDIPRNQITAFIGPSGCGKTTVLRCLNRMNDLIPEARVTGTITFHGIDLYGKD